MKKQNIKIYLTGSAACLTVGEKMADNKIRLQKFLAENGVASRRKSEELIERGKVRVNGHPAQLGDKVDPKRDIVTVSGERIEPVASGNVYIMLNKPRGYVTTMSDEMGRKCVAELVAEVDERIFPVGRLDKDSEGLLLFTNDGEFANMMTHPSMHISKTYRVTVKPAADEEHLVALSSGVEIDGRKTMPASVQVMSEDSDRSVLQITIHEGRNRQIRKMCEAVGLETIRLKRISMGSLKLGSLPVGKFRDLKKEEVSALKRSAQKAKSANEQKKGGRR